ncbi:hypothetical protein V8E53_002922 [Lactarius tabidus]
MIPCLDLIVTKMYPVTLFDFYKDADVKVTQEGPRREKDELAVHNAWTKTRKHNCKTNAFGRNRTTHPTSARSYVAQAKPKPARLCASRETTSRRSTRCSRRKSSASCRLRILCVKCEASASCRCTMPASREDILI